MWKGVMCAFLYFIAYLAGCFRAGAGVVCRWRALRRSGGRWVLAVAARWRAQTDVSLPVKDGDMEGLATTYTKEELRVGPRT